MKNNNYVGGQWVTGEGSIKNINPSDTNDTIDEYSNATSQQLNDAVASAHIAQKNGRMLVLKRELIFFMILVASLLNNLKKLGLFSQEKKEKLYLKVLEKSFDLVSNFNTMQPVH